jgi:hypothetical protein
MKAPTLAESKIVIALGTAFLLVALGFTFYMAFRFQYPSGVLATPPLGTQPRHKKPQARGSNKGGGTPEAPRLTDDGWMIWIIPVSSPGYLQPCPLPRLSYRTAACGVIKTTPETCDLGLPRRVCTAGSSHHASFTNNKTLRTERRWFPQLI